MRRNRATAVAVLVLSVTAGLPLVSVAHADTVDLYVDNTVNCSDYAPAAGGRLTPYCTVSAATAAVQAGQTVHIGGGFYREDVRLTHSGRPGAPITVEGPDVRPDNHDPAATVTGSDTGFTLAGVHDVVLRHVSTNAPKSAVEVTGSQHVVLDDITTGTALKETEQSAAVRITGRSSDVTLSHSQLQTSGAGVGVAVTPGVTGAVITTNVLTDPVKDGISVDGADGTVVTGNTVDNARGAAVRVSGGSTATTVENNVLSVVPVPGSGSTPSGLSVAADSTTGTRADYNVVATGAPRPYVWGGQTYDTPAEFRATGQGAHDLAGDRASITTPTEGSVVIDSADPKAPGESDTDVRGLARVHDPLVPGTGSHDRGATEFQRPPVALSLSVTPKSDISHPLDATVDFKATSPWATSIRTSVDFGDGSPVEAGATSPLTHTFPRTGTYQVRAVSTDDAGQTVVRTLSVDIIGTAPIAPQLKLSQDADLLSVHAVTTVASPWPITRTTFDYGDRTPVTDQPTHVYARPGFYRVTTTMTDTQGRTGTATATLTVTPEFAPVKPTRILDTRQGTGTPVGPGGVHKLKVAGVAGLPAGGMTAVLLNLTATRPTTGGYVTAYPTGTDRPTVSSLNFTTGQTVANAVVVPVGPDGTVSLYNFSGDVHLIADVQGYYGTTMPAAGAGNHLGSVAPTRVLDTRQGPGTPLGAGGTVKVKVRGSGLLPDAARAVVLNLTATRPTQSGYVTAAPDGNPPSSSSLNFAVGQTVANQVTVPIDPDGTVTLYNHNGSVHLIADLQGYYAAPGEDTRPLTTVTPTRLVDTRTTHSALGPGGTMRIRVAGVVPAYTKAVLVNLTAVGPTAPGYLTAYQAGSSRPGTSILNFTAGQTVPNLALVPVSADGFIEVYNFSGRTDLLVDLQGYSA
ncbi:PKD domain-containing protein [Kitasatospora sp. NPDC002227]|uniref:PKD domain-containing protein n=1 Tax=Kitasatospora sp. NPDC002227 TaxID=3154773 RepID=UPI00331BFF83